MSKLLQISIPAIIGVVLLVLYFVLEKSEKVSDADKNKCFTDPIKTIANVGSIEKGQKCYVLNSDGKCITGHLDVDSKGFQRDAASYQQATASQEGQSGNNAQKAFSGMSNRSNDLNLQGDQDSVGSLASYFVHCEPSEIYYKYDLLLWFGILSIIIAIVMNFVKFSK